MPAAVGLGTISANGSSTPLACNWFNTKDSSISVVVVPTISVLIEGSNNGTVWATVVVPAGTAMPAFTASGTAIIGANYTYLRMTASGSSGSPSCIATLAAPIP